MNNLRRTVQSRPFFDPIIDKIFGTGFYKGFNGDLIKKDFTVEVFKRKFVLNKKLSLKSTHKVLRPKAYYFKKL